MLGFRQLLFAYVVGIGAVVSVTGAVSAQDHPPRPPALRDMDANGDGRVSVGEFDKFRDAHVHKGPPPDGQKHASPPDKGEKPSKPMTARQIDINGDGIISQAEFDAAMARMPKPKKP